MSSATASPSSEQNRTTTTSRVVLAALIAIVAALVGNTVIAQLALTFGASDDFTPLTPSAYGFFTVVGVIAGLIGWLLVRRTAKAPTTLRWLVPAVLVLSLAPDVLLGFSDRAGVSWGAVVALMLMHVIVTVAAVVTFSRVLPVSRNP